MDGGRALRLFSEPEEIKHCLVSMMPIIPIVMVRIVPIVIVPIIAIVIVVIISVMISITPGQG